MMFLAIDPVPTPTPAQFNAAWTVLWFVSGTALNLVTVWAFTRRQKREVSFSFEPASKDDFMKQVERNEQDHKDLFAKIGGVERGALARIDTAFKEMQRSGDESRERLHLRINEILSAVSEMKGEVKHLRGRDGI
jgi:hypothetical protein